jgi:hypothetical protein
MKNDRLELLASTVMVPPMFWRDFAQGTYTVLTRFGIDVKMYVSTLTDFAFKERKDYDRFRDFLRDCTPLFEERYGLLESMSDNDIDYVFGRIRNERINQIVERLDL